MCVWFYKSGVCMDISQMWWVYIDYDCDIADLSVDYLLCTDTCIIQCMVFMGSVPTDAYIYIGHS